MNVKEVFLQILGGIIFYVVVVSIFRIAGKRLAGQTTTFDLIILISLSVAVQQATLMEGIGNTILFVIVVFSMHLLLTRMCQVLPNFRRIVRGEPCPLIKDGEVLYSSLRSEGLTVEELKSGLRKNGIEDFTEVKVAHLEETGQISAVKR